MSFARVRSLVVIGALTVAAVIFVVVAMVRDSQSGGLTAKGCPDGFVLANIRLPDDAKEVKVKVLNATLTADLEEQVAQEFRNRSFQVKGKGRVAVVNKVAVLRFGPKAVGAAHLLRAYFLDEAIVTYDKKRKDDIIDVVIGTEFQQLGTTTEVNQSLVELGHPELPEGACAADVT